jgi:hypothetical protein
LAANRLQISFSRPPAGCKLHPADSYPLKTPKFINSLIAAGNQPDEICIRLGANGMQILQKYAASTLLSS